MLMRVDSYLNAYHGYFWQWEDDATVLGIAGGNTIAYSQYIEALIDLLQEQGLPPFGSLLLALIAISANAKDDLKELKRRVESDYPDTAKSGLFDEAFAFLNTLQAMPESFKTGAKRIMLIQAAFQNAHNLLSPHKNKRLWEKHYLPDVLMLKNGISDIIVKREFSALAIQGRRLPGVAELEARILGLPEVDEDFFNFQTPERKEPKKGQEYVDELLEDDRAFKTASLIQSVWSGLDIPFQQTISSEQPIGGVSDLTNKGQFDKLLTSEFANDDITFLSRLANGEALYMNREAPPAENKFERVILLDASLKNWGRPKLIAHAVMLAIAKHPKSNFGYACYTLGPGYQRIGIETVEEVVDGLSNLETSIDASEGLSCFFEQHTISTSQQVIYIGAAEAMKSAAFLRAFNDYKQHIQFRVSITANGRVSLHKNTSKSLKHVHDFTLPLEKLWEQRKPSKEKHSTENGLDIGILLPEPPKCRDTLYTENGAIFKITNNGHILKSYSPKTAYAEVGWEEVGVGIHLPKGIYEIGNNEKGDWVLLVYLESDREILLINLTTGGHKKCHYPNWSHHTQWKKTWPDKSFIFFDGRFVHSNEEGTWNIKMDGTVEKDNQSNFGLLYVEERLAIVRKNQSRKSKHSVLKNIQSVYIGMGGELGFDSHLLRINPDQHIAIRNAHMTRPLVKAESVGEHEFIFSDSSQVSTSKQGYIILRSANSDLPTIYLPSVLGKTLGLAAGKHFTGNNYYQKYRQFAVYLDKRGGEPLKVVKTIKSRLGTGLKEARIKTDVGGNLGAFSLFEATQLLRKLEADGATARMEEETTHPGAADFAIMAGFQFFDTYIKAFIKHIVDHGA